MSVHNRTRCTSLGETLLTLNNHFRRTLGYLNGGGIPNDCVLWISPCRGIYTVGLKKAVDIAFLDRDGKVVKLFRRFPPGCFADSSATAVSALELPSDTLEKSGTNVGDLIEFDMA